MPIKNVQIVVPIRVHSPNVEEHPFERARRRKYQHGMTGKIFLIYCPRFRNPWVYDPSIPKRVLLTRLGPTLMDRGDNNNSSMKAVRDEIAKLMGVDDRDPIVTWDYEQRIEDAYGVEVLITTKEAQK